MNFFKEWLSCSCRVHVLLYSINEIPIRDNVDRKLRLFEPIAARHVLIKGDNPS